MTDPTDFTALQARMFSEMAGGDIYARATDHGRAYTAAVRDRHIAPDAAGLEGLAAFHEPLPDGPGDAGAIVDMLDRIGGPGAMAQTGGRFFGLVNGAAVPAGLAARLLADFWDQNTFLHAISPVTAEIEAVCENWLRDIFDLPEGTVAGFVSGTSMATLSGLAAARWRLYQTAGYDVNAKGLAGAPPLRIVTSEQAHGTVHKAVAMLGFGTDRIETVPTDIQGRLRIEALPALDDKTIIIAQAGNVNSGSFDPLRPICEAARTAGAWVHVDGAFGLWAHAVDGMQHLTDGLNLAHSWSVDGHKALNTPYDNGIILCADREALVGALQNSGSYIMYSDNRDGGLYTPEMSRRARAVELWATLKYLGRSGIAAMMTHMHDRAVQAAGGFRAAGFEVMNDVVFNQTVVGFDDVRFRDAMIDHIQKSGEIWVGGATWNGRPVIRFSVCSWATTPDDIKRAVQAFEAARASLV